MKKKRSWKKRIINTLITIVSLIALVYLIVFVGHNLLFKLPYSDKPTVKPIAKDGMIFGAASITQPKNFDEYIEVLSEQIKHYNEHLDDYWPDSSLENQYVIAQNNKDKTAVLISPKGEVKPLSQSEFKSYNIPTPLNLEGQWSDFSANNLSGAYLSIFVDNLTNYYTFQHYEHLGTYDQFLAYSHELFHSVTQEKWHFDDNNLTHSSRDERMEDIEARRIRMLLQQQLSQAFCAETKEETDAHILAALRTYQTYQEKCPEDFEKSVLFDRLEGTAFYYELVSSLYAGYPDQIKTKNDLYKGLRIILANDNPAYRTTGLTSEGYKIGGYAGLILDTIMIEDGEDPNSWKKEIEMDSKLTPLALLEKRYSDKKLPEQTPIPSEEDYNNWLAEYDKISPKPSRTAVRFDIAYSLLFK